MSATYLTVSEASNYLKIPEETLYKYARNGQIPASKVGRYWRFDQAKIDNWISNNSNQAQRPIRVLIVDDDPAVRNVLGHWLTDLGCDVLSLPNGSDAEFVVRQQGAELVLLDLLMPAPNGVETLEMLSREFPDLPVVIVTAHFNGEMMDRALKFGPMTILKKPASRQDLQGLLAMVRSLSGVGAQD